MFKVYIKATNDTKRYVRTFGGHWVYNRLAANRELTQGTWNIYRLYSRYDCIQYVVYVKPLKPVHGSGTREPFTAFDSLYFVCLTLTKDEAYILHSHISEYTFYNTKIHCEAHIKKGSLRSQWRWTLTAARSYNPTSEANILVGIWNHPLAINICRVEEEKITKTNHSTKGLRTEYIRTQIRT